MVTNLFVRYVAGRFVMNRELITNLSIRLTGASLCLVRLWPLARPGPAAAASPFHSPAALQAFHSPGRCEPGLRLAAEWRHFARSDRG